MDICTCCSLEDVGNRHFGILFYSLYNDLEKVKEYIVENELQNLFHVQTNSGIAAQTIVVQVFFITVIIFTGVR